MKKPVLLTCLLAACTSGIAQVVDGNVVAELNNLGFSSLLGKFTKDGKSYFTPCTYSDDGSAQVTIYDDDINIISNFSLPTVDNSLPYTITDQRFKIVVTYPDGYEEDKGFTGEWYQTRDESEIHSPVLNPYLFNLDQGIGGWDVNIPITQTLFNNDEEYEYIQPIYKYKVEKTELDRDSNGDIDYISTSYYPYLVGFKIMTVTGKELQRVDFEDFGMNYYYEGSFIIEINGKYYIAVYRDDAASLLFKINTSTSSIQQVGAPIKGMSVRPRMQNRGGSFTVELDGDSNVERDVVVVNSAGQTVWEQKVPAGQKIVNISASRLSQGLNVVTVRGGKQPESCKVIVK